MSGGMSNTTYPIKAQTQDMGYGGQDNAYNQGMGWSKRNDMSPYNQPQGNFRPQGMDQQPTQPSSQYGMGAMTPDNFNNVSNSVQSVSPWGNSQVGYSAVNTLGKTGGK